MRSRNLWCQFLFILRSFQMGGNELQICDKSYNLIKVWYCLCSMASEKFCINVLWINKNSPKKCRDASRWFDSKYWFNAVRIYTNILFYSPTLNLNPIIQIIIIIKHFVNVCELINRTILYRDLTHRLNERIMFKTLT